MPRKKKEIPASLTDDTGGEEEAVIEETVEAIPPPVDVEKLLEWVTRVWVGGKMYRNKRKQFAVRMLQDVYNERGKKLTLQQASKLIHDVRTNFGKGN